MAPVAVVGLAFQMVGKRGRVRGRNQCPQRAFDHGLLTMRELSVATHEFVRVPDSARQILSLTGKFPEERNWVFPAGDRYYSPTLRIVHSLHDALLELSVQHDVYVG